MSEPHGESKAATPGRIEESFEEARAIARTNPYLNGPLCAFLGTTELRGMGNDLIQHMRDEERWGEITTFEPIDFALAATEVAHDHTIGTSSATNVYINERLPAQITFDIFVDFWMPRLAGWAFGEGYASAVTTILQKAS
jgi:hypothetical protein